MSTINGEDKVVNATEVAKKLMSLRWQLKRVEFAKYCNHEDRKKLKITAECISLQINEFEESCDKIDALYHTYTRRLNELNKEKYALQEDLDEISTMFVETKDQLHELYSDVIVLKKRNAALKLKLLKQNDEINKMLAASSIHFLT